MAERARILTGRPLGGPPVVFRDTTSFMSIDRDHLIVLGDEVFLVTGTEREGRFGLEGEPKFWVKRALDLRTGARCILKLVFQEAFRITILDRTLTCVRSAEKEGRVLEAVRGDLRFMQGRVARDEAGNPVRIIDYITGRDLLSWLSGLPMPHEEYFERVFPGVLAEVIGLLDGLARLHACGLCHGDIRNDHVLVEEPGGRFRWIDFDLDQGSLEHDLWTVGNILHCVVAKGFTTFSDSIAARPELAQCLTEEDRCVVFPSRVMNLRKVYPYIPEPLNDVLLRFAVGARARFPSVAEVVAALQDTLERPTAGTTQNV
jgi:tRNA A-37 threonylcarbamoyl transferase component Bud32